MLPEYQVIIETEGLDSDIDTDIDSTDGKK